MKAMKLGKHSGSWSPSDAVHWTGHCYGISDILAPGKPPEMTLAEAERKAEELDRQIVKLLASQPTSVNVESVRRVFHNGEHNAFTDLIRFNGRMYLTFRSCPDGHMVHPTSSIIVLTSDDGEDWQQVHRFSVPKRDTRDPHFLVFKDRLFIFTGTWYCGETSPETYDMNQHLGYGVSTADGEEWTELFQLEGTYGHYIWRAAAHDSKAYLCGRRKRAFAETSSRAERDPIVESALLESDDGHIWTFRGLFQDNFGDETAFLFELDGSITAVARSGGGRNAQVCRASPPYDDFTRSRPRPLHRRAAADKVGWRIRGRRAADERPASPVVTVLAEE